MSKYLITGTAGFIGFHLANAILGQGNEVVGIDNINNYYDVGLKFDRLARAGIKKEDVDWNRHAHSSKWEGYRFIRMNLEDKDRITDLCRDEKFEYIIHLAAQAGVRYSLENPDAYIQSNVKGFLSILEACRQNPVSLLLYASSSSVYGNNEKVPFSEKENVDNPVSLYAATKRSNELMAFTYRHLYGIRSAGLRFFTVYGPWGRPDMAIYKFTEAMLNNKALQVYAGGTLLRDFTYVDDIISGIVKILKMQNVSAPPVVMNIGNNNPVQVNTLISVIEQCLEKKAAIEYLPMQPGDVKATFADINLINTYCGFKPETDLKTGIRNFCNWYIEYKKAQRR